MAEPTQANEPKKEKDIEFIKFILEHWGKIAGILSAVSAIFYGGYQVGRTLSKMEFETKTNSIINEKNKEIMDVREKYMIERLERSDNIYQEALKEVSKQQNKGGRDEK